MYNDKTGEPTMVPAFEPELISKQLKVEGFIVGRWDSRWMEGLNQMLQWIKEVLLETNLTGNLDDWILILKSLVCIFT